MLRVNLFTCPLNSDVFLSLEPESLEDNKEEEEEGEEEKEEDMKESISKQRDGDVRGQFRRPSLNRDIVVCGERYVI